MSHDCGPILIETANHLTSRHGEGHAYARLILTSTNADKMYGLYPRKGSIAIGADADLVIWNEGDPVRVTNDMLHHNVDYTPYEGMQLSAWPAVTLARGEVVWDGEPRAKPGHGKFLTCERPVPAQSRRRQNELPL